LKNPCALLRQRPSRTCRDCGDYPCVCNVAQEDREAALRRELRRETLAAFEEARQEGAAFWERFGPSEEGE
jgi:hypothetical protein